MLVKVQEVLEGRSAKGGRYLRVRFEGGKEAFVWSESIFPLFEPGKVLDVELAENGRFARVQGVKVPNTNGSGPAEGEPLELRGRAALRCVALRAAVELVRGRDKASVESALRAAEAFFSWLCEA